MLNKSRPVYKLNLKKQLKNKKEELIKDILNSKHKDTGSGYNFRVFTKYKDYLYDLFIKESKKILNPFTFKDKNFKVWDNFTAIGIAEGFEEADSEEQVLEAWQHLVTTGLAWQLQGSFGRTARSLIEEGLINE